MNIPERESPEAWLARRRTGLVRAQVLALVAVGIGDVLVVVSVAVVLAGGNLVLHLAELVFAILFLGFAIWRLIAARNQLRKFDEDGPDAGEQKPVR